MDMAHGRGLKGHLQVDADHHSGPERIEFQGGQDRGENGHDDEDDADPFDEQPEQKDDEHDHEERGPATAGTARMNSETTSPAPAFMKIPTNA